MSWLVRILTAALPLIVKYGPIAQQAAQDLVDALQSAPQSREAAVPSAADERLEALSYKVERHLQGAMEEETPAAPAAPGG